MKSDLSNLQSQKERLRTLALADEAIREKICLRAYEIYERRGTAPGSPLDDWLQAEDEIFSTLVDQERQSLEERTGGKHLNRDIASPSQAKAVKKSKSRVASVKTTERKARSQKTEPASTPNAKGKKATDGPAGKSSSRTRKKPHKSESRAEQKADNL